MKVPNRRDFEESADYDAATLRYEDWAESDRDFQNEKSEEKNKMTTERLMANHLRECSILADEIETFATKEREAHDFAIFDGLVAQVKMLKGIGIHLRQVAELESRLREISKEVFAGFHPDQFKIV